MEFKAVMDHWIEIKNQLKAVRGDVKILNTQEKTLRLQIQEFMKTQEITTCNVSDKNARIQIQSRNCKTPFNKELVRKALMRYFRNDESLVEHVMNLIDEEKEVSQKDSISLKNM